MADTDWNNLFDKVITIEILLSIIPLVFFFRDFKFSSQAVKVTGYYLTISFGLNILFQSTYWFYFEFWEPIIEYLQLTDNNFTYFIYFTLDIIIIYYLSKHILLNEKWILFFKWHAIIAITILWIYTIFFSNWRNENVIATVYNLLFCATAGAIMLYQIYTRNVNIALKNNPYLYFFIGYVFSNIISIFQWVATHFIYTENIPAWTKIAVSTHILLMFTTILNTLCFMKAKYSRFLPYGHKPMQISQHHSLHSK